MIRIGRKAPIRHYLREWRQLKGLTQEQLADRLETGKDTISRYERDDRKLTIEVAAAFAEALGIEPMAIFRHPDQPSADELLARATPEQRRQAMAIIETLLKTG